MTWPLPEHAFVPGQTARPTQGPVFDAANSAPPVTDPVAWKENGTYLYGINLHNHGFHWEAHEVWEPVWMGCAANTRERALMQGLIQLTNACLKLRMGRTKACDRLIGIARGHLSEAGPVRLMGLSPDRLGNQAADLLQDRKTPKIEVEAL